MNQETKQRELKTSEINISNLQEISKNYHAPYDVLKSLMDLKTDSSLEKANFSTCEISDTGAQIISISLRHNITLIEQDLKDNYITNKGAEHLSKGIQINRKYRLV